MKTGLIPLVAVILLFLPMRAFSQSSTVPWSTSSMGFQVSSSPTTILKSLVGQGFHGIMQGAHTSIESGFLADTLFRTVTSLRESKEIPKDYALRQNFPNPFNPSTDIRFELPHASDVSLKVYNVLGQEVLTLVEEDKPAGVYDVCFDATGLSSGMYIYRLQASTYVQARMLLLLR